MAGKIPIGLGLLMHSFRRFSRCTVVTSEVKLPLYSIVNGGSLVKLALMCLTSLLQTRAPNPQYDEVLLGVFARIDKLVQTNIKGILPLRFFGPLTGGDTPELRLAQTLRKNVSSDRNETTSQRRTETHRESILCMAYVTPYSIFRKRRSIHLCRDLRVHSWQQAPDVLAFRTRVDLVLNHQRV